ncbi:MAG TPA: aminotransferase class IV [Polyangiaceae bacterium]|jgi:branched-chain amino acid aminotransferase|nr:aminotransferase class IV [Polyangiaceae bacterium]
MSRVVMIDGKLCAPDAAVVSVFDRGFLYGDSVFETLRTYGGKVFAIGDHLERLERSAQRVHIRVPVTRAQLTEEIAAAILASDNTESYVRVMITRGQGELGLDPDLAGEPLRVIIVGELHPPSDELRHSGIKTITFKTQRASDATSAEGAKIGNYLVAVLAMRAARAAGAAEALIVDGQGRVVEGASSNLFFVSQGSLFTPGLDLGILAGITRSRVLEAAAQLGVATSYVAPSIAQLVAADEIFISSSIREILGVVQVDERSIGDGKVGPLTRALFDAFRHNVLRELDV